MMADRAIFSRLLPFIAYRWNVCLFTTSSSKITNTFFAIEFIALSTLKLVNPFWYKNLSKRVFEAKIIIQFFWLLKTTCNLRQLSTPLMDVCNLVLLCSDIFPKSGRTNRKGFFLTVETFSFLRIWVLFKDNLKYYQWSFLDNHFSEIKLTARNDIFLLCTVATVNDILTRQKLK